MFWTRTLIATAKQRPEGAEMASHVLMVRAGLIARVMAGCYAYLPLGSRSLRKAERIVRGEMEAGGAIEVAMPALSPVTLWERSGRLESLGPRLIRLAISDQDRRLRAALGPSHEEVTTELISRQVSSYRQLPITLYQITRKFHNPKQTRHGALQSYESLTKDAYSFHASVESLREAYRAVEATYRRILSRCGLDCLVVESEGGLGDGDPGHEFVVPAEHGEQTVLHCRDCGYAANGQRAEIGARDVAPPDLPRQDLRPADTPGCTTVAEVSGLLGCPPEDLIKTLIYLADGKPIAVLIPGHYEANEQKIRRAVGAEAVAMADPETIRRVTGAPVGFAGPVGLPAQVPLWADRDVRPMVNAVTGANRADAHLTGVNPGRDFRVDRFADLRNAVDGDPCPRCSSNVQARQAIVIGRLDKPGARFSRALGARFLDDREQQGPILMGSYRLDLERILVALVETSHDADGIIWPLALAPYEVILLPLSTTDRQAMDTARRLHDALAAAGIEVLLDDRDARPGVKLKDADLIGIPLRVVIGQRGLEQGALEIKWRWEAGAEMANLDQAAETIMDLIRRERSAAARSATRA